MLFGRCVLIVGTESLLGERYAQLRIDEALEERPNAQVNKANAIDVDASQLAEMTGSSLFSTDSISVIFDLGSLRPELVQAVLDVALNTPTNVALILVHGGGNKGKSLLDKLKKSGIEKIEAMPVKPWEIHSFVNDEAKRAGVRIGRDAAAALVDAVGHDLRAIAAALAQLAADCDGIIDKAMVATYFSGRAEVTSFAVADAAIDGDTQTALSSLRWALATGVAGPLLTSAMANGLRKIAMFLDLKNAPMSDMDMAIRLGAPKFKVNAIRKSSAAWTSGGVAEALQAVAAADPQVKGGSLDPEYALERMVLSVIGARGPR